MNNKGFTLIELLGCFVILGIVFGIGIYFTSGTLSTSLSTIENVSKNEIYSAGETYVLEYGVRWNSVEDTEYVCISISQLVNAGYFETEDVVNYNNDFVKIIRNINTKVTEEVMIVKECN